ncbi:O-methyltransferase [Apiospora kogelbergensis]|uniref:O-methyltransferase n=1 Tax=Apiospora kogelbergensis TaxID=1337665 RepID=A0AAW0QPQ7_9PEZI
MAQANSKENTKAKTAGGSEPATAVPGSKITLTGTQQTNLTTLCARARDAVLARPLLNDTWALHVLNQVKDYDFRRVQSGRFGCAFACKRALILDRWAQSWLDEHPRATVIHLACGLDSRCLRLRWGGGAGAVAGSQKSTADVCWVDLDLPDVVDLRRKLVPQPPPAPGVDYRLMGVSATDSGWLDDVPADRPTLIIMEGLTMYLPERDGLAMLRRLLQRFSSGALIFDAVGSLTFRLQSMSGVMRKTGARLTWAIDEPRHLELLDERLRFVENAGGPDLMSKGPHSGILPAPCAGSSGSSATRR